MDNLQGGTSPTAIERGDPLQYTHNHKRLMRKIETLMNQAISDNAEWRLDNTAVTLNDAGESEVFLHGNLIARIGENLSLIHI